ncbi:GIY-YIG nuclease family protein [Brevundimonas sp. M1A4_2e]
MYFYTYILAGRRNGVLYTGSTDDLLKRVMEHRAKLRGGFTANTRSPAWSGMSTTERATRPFVASARSRNGAAHGSSI